MTSTSSVSQATYVKSFEGYYPARVVDGDGALRIDNTIYETPERAKLAAEKVLQEESEYDEARILRARNCFIFAVVWSLLTVGIIAISKYGFFIS